MIVCSQRYPLITAYRCKIYYLSWIKVYYLKTLYSRSVVSGVVDIRCQWMSAMGLAPEINLMMMIMMNLS